MPQQLDSKSPKSTEEQVLTLKRKRNWLLKRYKTQTSSFQQERAIYEERLNAQQQMLQQTTDYLTDLQNELKEKNENILASVQYASYIQHAIIPEIEKLREYIPESFIFYQPKDIVSGDLPYLKVYGESILIAAMDCTGHGVPGAMLSMLGYSLLNEIVSQTRDLSPAKILALLHDLVVRSFSQNVSGRMVQDGMDLALLQYFPATGAAVYAGAKRPLLAIQNGVLREYEGSDSSIGGDMAQGNTFIDHNVSLKGGDALYLYSDGIADQFGEATGRKFLKSRLRDLISTIAHLPAVAQQTHILEAFNNWKGNLEQTDDVLVLGLKW